MLGGSQPGEPVAVGGAVVPPSDVSVLQSRVPFRREHVRRGHMVQQGRVGAVAETEVRAFARRPAFWRVSVQQDRDQAGFRLGG